MRAARSAGKWKPPVAMHGKDARKGNGTKFLAHGDVERISIADGEPLRFALIASAPARPHGMNDAPARHRESVGNRALALRNGRQRAASPTQLRTGRPMNRAVDAAPARKHRLRGVDDGVHLKGRDVGLKKAQIPRQGSSPLTSSSSRRPGPRMDSGAWAPRVRRRASAPIRLRRTHRAARPREASGSLPLRPTRRG